MRHERRPPRPPRSPCLPLPRSLGSGTACCLALPVGAIFLLDLLATRAGWGPSLALAGMSDPTGQGNLAAWLLALPGLAVLPLAWGVARTIRGWPARLLVGALGVSAALLAAADAAGLRVGSPPLRALEACVALALLLLSLCVSRTARGRLLLLAAFVLLLSNPVSERAEQRLVSDGDNYAFVSADAPYRFDADAWRELWLVTRAQELSEVLAMLCVLLALESVVPPALRRRDSAPALSAP